jgi:hypothetical protein
MGYIFTDYAVPGGSVSKRFWATGIEYGAFNAVAIPKPLVAPWFAMPLDFQVDIDLTRNHGSFPWTIVAGIELCNAAGTPLYTISGGYLNVNISLSGNAAMDFTASGLFGADIAKARPYLSCALAPGGDWGDADCVVSSGTLRVYYTPEGMPPADVEAESDAGSELPKNLVIAGGATGKRITKLRYRFAQSVDGALDWSGTVAGEAMLHRFS